MMEKVELKIKDKIFTVYVTLSQTWWVNG